MSDDMTTIKSLASQLNDCKPPQYVKINELNRDEPYLITNLRRITNRFGPTVVAMLEDKQGEMFMVYLPRKYIKVLSESMVNHFNNSENKSMSLLFNHKSNDIEFIEH